MHSTILSHGVKTLNRDRDSLKEAQNLSVIARNMSDSATQVSQNVQCRRVDWTQVFDWHRHMMMMLLGTRYMVVDCGGGTVDITVYEMTADGGKLKELHMATGGPHGSTGRLLDTVCYTIIQTDRLRATTSVLSAVPSSAPLHAN